MSTISVIMDNILAIANILITEVLSTPAGLSFLAVMLILLSFEIHRHIQKNKENQKKEAK